jgi:hypothetical protein
MGPEKDLGSSFLAHEPNAFNNAAIELVGVAMRVLTVDIPVCFTFRTVHVAVLQVKSPE